MSVSPDRHYSRSIQNGDEQVAEAGVAVGPAPDAQPACRGKARIRRLEQRFAVERDFEAIVDSLDAQRLGLAHDEPCVASGDLAPLAVDDAEKAHAPGERIG